MRLRARRIRGGFSVQGEVEIMMQESEFSHGCRPNMIQAGKCSDLLEGLGS